MAGTAVRQGAALGSDDPPPSEVAAPAKVAATVPEHVLRENVEETTVVLYKETDQTRIGIGLRADVPERAVVNTVAAGSPASLPMEPGSSTPLIRPYDELLEVGGTPVQSAVHAVQLIREAHAGELIVRKAACPERVLNGVMMLQDTWRAAFARQEGVVRRIITKPMQTTMLGLSFSPEYAMHSIIKKLNEGGVAERALEAGDRIVRVNGVLCDNPAATARMLRECDGRIELQVIPAAHVDEAELSRAEQAYQESLRAEEEARYQEAERARLAAYGPEGVDEDDEYGEEEDELSYEDDEHPSGDDRYYMPRAANGEAGTDVSQADPFPSQRPAAVSTNARRLPPSLSNLSPGTADEADHFPTAKTSSTRAPVMSGGKKPEGWREWLQQRRSAAAVQPKDPHQVPHLNQRV